MMRIGICDDEKEIRNAIERNIHRLYAEAETVQFEDGNDLLSRAEPVDILFLDIRMGGADGIEVARALRKAGDPVVIIFVTALEEYVFQAFDVRAFHYLLKPIEPVKFFEVLREAVEDSRQNRAAAMEEKPCITIKKGTITRRIFLCEIVCLEVSNRKVTLHTTDENIQFYGKLAELEKSLGRDFVRCHRAYIVNLRYVASYDAGSITMDNGETVLLAKQKYADFVKSYACWLREQQEKGVANAGAY